MNTFTEKFKNYYHKNKNSTNTTKHYAHLLGEQKNDNIPPLLSNGTVLTDDQEKATLLNDHFAQQSTLNIPDDRLPPPITTVPVTTLEQITTNEHEVLQILNSLDPNKSTGPDGIPVKFLKMTALLIAKPLSELFMKSLSLGIYPEEFKKANIKPIFKNKGSASDPTCYRPISLLSAVSKVFEKIVHKNLLKHITDHALLTEKTKRLSKEPRH